MSRLKSMYIDFLFVLQSGSYSSLATAVWIERTFGYNWPQSKALERMFRTRLIAGYGAAERADLDYN